VGRDTCEKGEGWEASWEGTCKGCNKEVEDNREAFRENPQLLIHLFQHLLANLFFFRFPSFIFPFLTLNCSHRLSIFHDRWNDDDACVCAHFYGFSFSFRATVKSHSICYCGMDIDNEVGIQPRVVVGSSNEEGDIAVREVAVAGLVFNLPSNDANLVKLGGKWHG